LLVTGSYLSISQHTINGLLVAGYW